MLFSDALTLDAPRRTADGYLAVRAKAARTGHYAYLGSEVDPDNKHGLRDAGMVNILRDDSAVFDTASAHSFIGKPVTDNHPSVAVNASNWRDHARGVVMGAMKDGEYLAFDLLLTDADTIAAVDAGKRELSNGYGADLVFGDFTAADGTKCVAKQTAIKGNHVAIVDRGRAGPSCAITDKAAICDAIPLPTLKTEKPVTKMIIDGLTVDVSDAETAKATITSLIAARDEATAAAAKSKEDDAENKKQIVAKDAEIAKLTKDLADAKPTPAQLRDAAKAYALTCDKAKAMGVEVTDAMDEAAIKRAVVDKAMGDKAKDYSDEHVAISFDTLTKDAKPAGEGVKPLGTPTFQNDAAAEGAAYQRMVDRMTGKKGA